MCKVHRGILSTWKEDLLLKIILIKKKSQLTISACLLKAARLMYLQNHYPNNDWETLAVVFKNRAYIYLAPFELYFSILLFWVPV